MAAATKRSGNPLEDIDTKGPRPLYLVDGEERVLVDEAVRRIKSSALPKAARDFNLDVFSGKTTSIDRILGAALTLPAFSPRRLVLVDHADKLLQKGTESEGEAEVDEGVAGLVRYAENPVPTTVLVFVGEKFDARTRVFKALAKNAVVLRYSRPKPREVPDLIRERARTTNVRIEEPAVRALAETVGTDASAAIRALELLSLYVGPDTKQAVTAADVESLITETREESVFALADAIGKQDRPAALKGLHSMLELSREHPLRVLAMIARHYRNLARARSLLDAGAPKQKIETDVGVPSYFLDGLLSQARRRPVESFVAGLGAIALTDRELKGGRLDHARAMERLVLKLMRD